MPKLIIMHSQSIDNGFYFDVGLDQSMTVEFYDENNTYSDADIFLFDWFLTPQKSIFEQELRSEEHTSELQSH